MRAPCESVLTFHDDNFCKLHVLYACTGDACALETRRRFVTEQGKKKEPRFKPRPHCLGNYLPLLRLEWSVLDFVLRSGSVFGGKLVTVDHLQNEGYAYTKRYRTKMVDLLLYQPPPIFQMLSRLEKVKEVTLSLGTRQGPRIEVGRFPPNSKHFFPIR